LPDKKQKITIVGMGLIGGSLGLALRQGGFQGKIAAVSSPATLKLAKPLGLADQAATYEEIGAAAAGSDFVFLCAPIHAIAEHLAKLRRQKMKLAPGCIVTDTGSTKSFIMGKAGIWEPQAHFIGGHPMAGSEKSGLSAADPYLFQNAIYCLTPGKKTPPEAVERLGELVKYIGAKVIVLAPGVHDRIAAAISHLPQLLAVALVNQVARYQGRDPHYLQLAAGGFRDMTRIASSPFRMWKDIIATNDREIGKLLDDFIKEIRLIKKELGKDALAERFNRAAETRGAIAATGKGFLHPLAEVLVMAEDKPGILAAMCGALAQARINIKDIDLLKVRENEAGTFRLAFDTREIAEQAVRILGEIKVRARIKE